MFDLLILLASAAAKPLLAFLVVWAVVLIVGIHREPPVEPSSKSPS